MDSNVYSDIRSMNICYASHLNALKRGNSFAKITAFPTIIRIIEYLLYLQWNPSLISSYSWKNLIYTTQLILQLNKLKFLEKS